MTLYTLLGIWFSSLSSNSWKSLHIKGPSYNSFFLMAEKYFIVCKSHNLFNHFFITRYSLGVIMQSHVALEHFYLKRNQPLQIQLQPAHMPPQPFISLSSEVNTIFNLVYTITTCIFTLYNIFQHFTQYTVLSHVLNFM